MREREEEGEDEGEVEGEEGEVAGETEVEGEEKEGAGKEEDGKGVRSDKVSTGEEPMEWRSVGVLRYCVNTSCTDSLSVKASSSSLAGMRGYDK